MLTDSVRIDDLVLRVDVDLASLVLSRLDRQQQQVQLRVANLGDLQVKLMNSIISVYAVGEGFKVTILH